ncbi:sodium/proton antiporter, CPA1 family (TC 2.A.36) [Duganella sp. CF402]|uniref:cation:proton antiporter n=1 Tax=unclassified Duganella TaxID=2636909 RepID=UPI0008B699D2|nr:MULTISPECIES: cation:proton antiporter [unclassified Duganella]RZT10303.1 sodium/proton antiporter (CPA1 family) [Duganella sp. BK701]SEL19572.1 sodium/proton antiporter, CPA1 family (TC 2.A.36) [Duganella sp. CF402]
MSTNQWFLLVGLLMLARGLAATTISRSPFTSAIVYLCVGILLGPSFLGILRFDPWKQSALLEMLTQTALLISLFSAGIKMPVPFKLARWNAPLRLAWISMTLTVALVALFAWYVLHFPPGAAILLGGILAPTDPVLATDVQVRHPGDKDQLRFTLTCEAGMNDGSAFPFVLLGLAMLGVGGDHNSEHYLRWLLVDVVWATAGAVAVGVAAGAGLARLGWQLRVIEPRHDIMDDLVALGLIAIVYAVASMLKTSGYLAVFFAAVALRQTELVLAGAPKDRQGLLEPDVAKSEAAQDSAPPLVVSAEALVFKEHLERLSELTLVLLLGGMISLRELPYETIGVAAFLFVIARPLAVYVGLMGSGVGKRMRVMTGWFGVRGIGSIFYLVYAIQAGLPPNIAHQLTGIAFGVVMLSILMHGFSVKPLIDPE